MVQAVCMHQPWQLLTLTLIFLTSFFLSLSLFSIFFGFCLYIENIIVPMTDLVLLFCNFYLHLPLGLCCAFVQVCMKPHIFILLPPTKKKHIKMIFAHNKSNGIWNVNIHLSFSILPHSAPWEKPQWVRGHKVAILWTIPNHPPIHPNRQCLIF